MPYQVYVPPTAANISYTGDYAALSYANQHSAGNYGKYLRLSAGSGLTWSDLVFQAALNMNNYAVTNASGVLTTTLGSNSGSLNVLNTLNFNDATASNRNITGVNDLTATGTSTLTTLSSTTGTVTTITSTNAVSTNLQVTSIKDNGGGSFSEKIRFGAWTEMYSTFDLRSNLLKAINVVDFVQAPGTGTAVLLDGSNRMIVSSSSRATKENFSEYDGDSSKIYDFKLMKYNYKGQTSPNQKCWGYIAEDLNELYPCNDSNLVQTNANDQIIGLNYNMITCLMLEEMKKLKAEITTLKNRCTELESRIPV